MAKALSVRAITQEELDADPALAQWLAEVNAGGHRDGPTLAEVRAALLAEKEAQ